MELKSIRPYLINAADGWVGVAVNETSEFKFKIHHLSHITHRIESNKISFRIVSTNSINIA